MSILDDEIIASSTSKSSHSSGDSSSRSSRSRCEDAKDEEGEDDSVGNITAITSGWLSPDEEDPEFFFYADRTSSTYTLDISDDLVLTFKQDPVLRNRVNRSDDLSESERESATGAVVWNTCICLGMYLYRHSEKIGLRRERIRCLELGSGCGVGGMLVAAAGCAEVVLSDRGEILELLKHNVDLNRKLVSAKCTTVSLDWGPGSARDLETPFDVIFCADTVYDVEIVEPLLQTLVVMSSPKTDIFLGWDSAIGFHDVYKEFQARASERFEWKHIPRDELDPSYAKRSVVLLHMRRR